METVFQSEMEIRPNGPSFSLDCTRFFEDVKEEIQREEKCHPEGRINRKHPLQWILNSTSAGYLSSTVIKGFLSCPANYVYEKTVPYNPSSAASVGTSFHKIMEEFYSLEPEERDESHLDLLRDEVIKENGEEAERPLIQEDLDGYFAAKDYLTGAPMDHKSLICDTEKFFRVYLNPLGASFAKPAYCLLDRLDYREDGNLYIIDYKTSATAGNPTETSLGINGYLPQLIFYKWAVEQKLGREVEAVMICAPTADEEHKYSKVDVNSLESQRQVIEQVREFEREAEKAHETNLFHGCDRPYCQTCRKIREKLRNHHPVLPVEIKFDAEEYWTQETASL